MRPWISSHITPKSAKPIFASIYSGLTWKWFCPSQNIDASPIFGDRQNLFESNPRYNNIKKGFVKTLWQNGQKACKSTPHYVILHLLFYPWHMMPLRHKCYKTITFCRIVLTWLVPADKMIMYKKRGKFSMPLLRLPTCKQEGRQTHPYKNKIQFLLKEEFTQWILEEKLRRYLLL